jgi:hypothetical protein
MSLRTLLGRRAQKRCGFPRKKKLKHTERREWRKDFADEELYPELEENNE